MKTRDELAEALLLASVATDPTTERTRMMSPEAAYRQADAFVAERERRAGEIPEWRSFATMQISKEQADGIALALGCDTRGLPLGQAIEKIKELLKRSDAA